MKTLYHTSLKMSIYYLFFRYFVKRLNPQKSTVSHMFHAFTHSKITKITSQQPLKKYSTQEKNCQKRKWLLKISYCCSRGMNKYRVDTSDSEVSVFFKDLKEDNVASGKAVVTAQKGSGVVRIKKKTPKRDNAWVFGEENYN